MQPLPSVQPPPAEPATGSKWPWIVALLALAALAAAAFLWLRRRIGPLGPVVVPEIERPNVVPAGDTPLAPDMAAPTPSPPLPAAAAEPHPLRIEIEPRKLALTMMNATLGYRLTLTNGGPEPLSDIAVFADLIGAHASLPREAQLAGPASALAERHRLAGLAPGESAQVTGDLRLPLASVRPIVQGAATLFVPLARFRIAAAGQEPRCFTLSVGQPSPRGGGAIQPIRLDHGPRIYDGLAGRAF